jgi:hypothetical protein
VIPKRRKSSEPALLHVASHKLLDELQIEPNALFDLISSASRLKMAVRGWVAEAHLEAHLKNIHGVTDCVRLQGDGKPDVSLRWKGSKSTSNGPAPPSQIPARVTTCRVTSR